MSGWTAKYAAPVFELTATKAGYWHRNCSQGCADLEDIWRNHLADQGFELVRDGGTYIAVTWPGAVAGVSTEGTGPLWTALSGLPSTR